MDLGNFNPQDIQQYLQGVNFPADKQDVASQAGDNGAPQGIVDQIKNAAQQKFNNPEEVMQAIQGQ